MSAPKSNFSKLIKKADEMDRRRQEQIARQAKIIDRLVKTNMVYGDALTAIIEQETWDGKLAGAIAQEALDKGKALLAVNEEEQV